MLRSYRRTLLAVAGLSTFALAGCPNDYTCYDYLNCPPDAGPDAQSDVVRDAHGDTSQTHHDGGTDGTKDGHVAEGGGPTETGLPDVIVTSDGPKDAPVDTFTCTPSADPSSEPCVINEMFGVFVAPVASGGSDTTGSGTRAAPYATISHALVSLGTLTRVYACAGTYAEAVTVNAAVDGVQVYGGLVCPGSDGGSGAWSYGSGFASVVPATRGFALDVESLVKGALFEDIGFTSMAGDPTVPGASSIAVMVNASTGVSFTRVHATAGAGVAGTSGVAVPAVAGGTGTNWCPTAGQGGLGSTNNGGAGGGQCTCAVAMVGATQESSTGGPGGGATLQAGNGSSAPVVANTASPVDGKGQAGSSTGPGGACLNGHAGADGTANLGGIPGSTAILAGVGLSVQQAGNGAPGDPGEGGGGGGGSAMFGGAGGGAGGCGGNGGVGGSGGGGSIAISIVASALSMTSVTLSTGSGGAGGSGAAGEAGEVGGAKGADQGTADGCNGGNGGAGAGGSGGGGGAGGPSVGIAWTGTTTSLTLDGMTVTGLQSLPIPSAFTSGGGGALGPGGNAGVAATGGNAGAAGAPGPTGSSNAVVAF